MDTYYVSKDVQPAWNTLQHYFVARDYIVCITLILKDTSMTIYIIQVSAYLFFSFSLVWLSQCASECGEWSLCLVDRSTWQHPHLLDWRWSRGLQGLSMWLKSKKEYVNLSFLKTFFRKTKFYFKSHWFYPVHSTNFNAAANSQTFYLLN